MSSTPDFKTHANALHAMFKHFENEIAELKNENINSAEENNKALSCVIQMYVTRLESMQVTNATLQKEVDAQAKHNKHMHNMFNRVSNNLVAANAEIDRLTSNGADLPYNRSRTGDTITALETEISEMKKRNVELTTDLATARDKIVELNNANVELALKNADLSAERARLISILYMEILNNDPHGKVDGRY